MRSVAARVKRYFAAQPDPLVEAYLYSVRIYNLFVSVLVSISHYLSEIGFPKSDLYYNGPDIYVIVVITTVQVNYASGNLKNISQASLNFFSALLHCFREVLRYWFYRFSKQFLNGVFIKEVVATWDIYEYE